jgi:PAS domain S-box-containing protein
MAYSYRAHAPDGRLVHVKNFCKLVYDERSRPVRAFGVSWDVTSEVEAAARLAQQTQQLQDAERRLERASLSSFEGHWESDFATGRLWFSSSYHALLGYPDGQLPSAVHEFTNLVHADDLAMSRTALAEHLSQATNYMVDLRLRTASGEYRWFRLRGAAERDRDGKPVTMSGSIQDVHEQKLTADALRRAQSRFERAMNGTQDGLCGSLKRAAMPGPHRASRSCSVTLTMSFPARRTSCATFCIRTMRHWSPRPRRLTSKRRNRTTSRSACARSAASTAGTVRARRQSAMRTASHCAYRGRCRM